MKSHVSMIHLHNEEEALDSWWCVWFKKTFFFFNCPWFQKTQKRENKHDTQTMRLTYRNVNRDEDKSWKGKEHNEQLKSRKTERHLKVMLRWEMAPLMIVTQVWYEDRKRERHTDEHGKERETGISVLKTSWQFYSPLPRLHTSGTEWSMADRRRPVDILEEEK